ncbi:MAG: hypothetical protein HWE08_01850, partial [Alphaproteobacteria bacterium]|nr:hypothetical protein [Alphaproteobacteria bacterium]
GASGGLSGFSADSFLVSFQRADTDMRFPSHVTDYLKSMQLRNSQKKGRVEIEEFERPQEQPEEKKENQ